MKQWTGGPTMKREPCTVLYIVTIKNQIVRKSNMGSVVMQAIQYAVAMKIHSRGKGESRLESVI